MPRHTPVPDKVSGREDILALAELWRDLVNAPDQDEEAKATLRTLLSKTRRFTHTQRHGGDDCPMVTIDLPLDVTGNQFTINHVGYGPALGSPKGATAPVTVHRCVAQELLRAVYMNQEVDVQRMREGGRRGPVDLGAISARARVLNQD